MPHLYKLAIEVASFPDYQQQECHRQLTRALHAEEKETSFPPSACAQQCPVLCVLQRELAKLKFEKSSQDAIKHTLKYYSYVFPKGGKFYLRFLPFA